MFEDHNLSEEYKDEYMEGWGDFFCGENNTYYREVADGASLYDLSYQRRQDEAEAYDAGWDDAFEAKIVKRCWGALREFDTDYIGEVLFKASQTHTLPDGKFQGTIDYYNLSEDEMIEVRKGYEKAAMAYKDEKYRKYDEELTKLRYKYDVEEDCGCDRVTYPELSGVKLQ